MSEVGEIRAQAEAAIAERLTRGEAGWDELRANRFPSIPRATWFRWVAAVKQAVAADVARQEAAAAVQRRIVVARAEGDAAGAVVVQGGYVPPSEAMGLRGFDLPRRIKEAFADIDMLAAHAKTDDGSKIRVPLFLTQSLALKQRYIETALRVAQAAADVEFQVAFYDAVTAALVETLADHPELQERVIRRLHGLLGEHDRTHLPAPMR